jgi:hypothetical protein
LAAKQFSRPERKVSGAGGNIGMAAAHLKGACGKSLHLYSIVQLKGMHNGKYFMIAVRPYAQHIQGEVYLGPGSYIHIKTPLSVYLQI